MRYLILILLPLLSIFTVDNFHTYSIKGQCPIWYWSLLFYSLLMIKIKVPSMDFCGLLGRLISGQGYRNEYDC